MKNSLIVTTAILLVMATGSYLMITYDGTIRAVEFLSVFAIGALAGVLLTQFVLKLKGKSKTT